MRTTTINFRGNPDVVISYRDHGYEHDTGAHPIEWEFEDDFELSQAILGGEITYEEENAIRDHIMNLADDEAPY